MVAVLPGSWPWPESDGIENGPLFPSLHLLAEYFGHSFSPRATLSSRLTLPTDRPEPEAIDFAKEDKRRGGGRAPSECISWKLFDEQIFLHSYVVQKLPYSAALL